jgi:hypothetical protein
MNQIIEYPEKWLFNLKFKAAVCKRNVVDWWKYKGEEKANS